MLVSLEKLPIRHDHQTIRLLGHALLFDQLNIFPVLPPVANLF